MKKITQNLYFILLVTIAFLAIRSTRRTDLKENNVSIYPKEDTTSLLRNPAMGWGVYDDAGGEVANADEYWKVQDKPVKKYASYFYIRWRWSDMEPEEGKYAWIYDENFKKLVKGALDRNLKLAFRVYINGQDNIQPGTPDYVKKAGAKGYYNNGRNGQKNWTPYPDDSVFQAKYSKFIQAFAKEFDDPLRVDFVDGNGLGQWGEGDNIRTIHHDQLSVFKWIINLYASNFKKVLLVTNLGSQEGMEAEKEIAYLGNDFLPRRDGLGSHWYNENQKKMMASLFPQMPLIGESCYWQSDSTVFNNDPVFKDYAHPITWKDVFELTYWDAISSHANTLDLREPLETRRWISQTPGLVQDFIINGGYRFYPSKLSVPKEIKAGGDFVIEHEWRNTGVGMCPNNNKRWNYKYKVAFALLDKSNMQVIELFIDSKSDPSEWIKGTDTKYSFRGKLPGTIKAGNYILGVAIIDTTDNKPGIQLAIKDLPKGESGWFEIGKVRVSK